MPYLHGAYAFNNPSGLTVPAKSTTLPVLFGVSPVQQLPNFAASVQIPVLLDSDRVAAAKMGYSEQWPTYTLCEPHFVHFRSAEPSGPVVFVNVLDPAKHKKATKTTQPITFVNGVAYLVGLYIILATIKIADKELGIDYDAAYDSEGKGVVITDLTDTMVTEVTVEWYDVEITTITPQLMAEVIKKTVPLVYEISGSVPTLFGAPGWSHHKEVNDALKNAAQAVNGHWNGFIYDDIDVQQALTGDAALIQKKADGRNAAIESPCWPMATDGQRCYHLSTLTIAKSLIVDAVNGGSPHETTSNKAIAITGLVVGDGKGGYVPFKQDKLEANKLNAAGIKTAIFWGGKYVLWGPHTGAYDYNGATAAEEVFDCSVRMTQYIGNNFQLRYGTEVDKPMQRSRIDSILNSFQEWLDNLIARGALLFGEISFVPENNPTTDMIAGEFVFDTGYTTTPPGRAIVNRFRYTAAGLEKLAGGEG